MFENKYYIYTIFKEGSFSKAAKKLFISQPSLSATVKRVEEKIGYPIFDRSTKKLHLTELGQEYIKSTIKLMEIEDQFRDYINDLGNLQTGHLAIGGSNLFSSWILPKLMRAFTTQYPAISMELKEESMNELIHLLHDGQIDLLIENSILDESLFDKVLFCEDHLLLAVPEDYSENNQLITYQVPVEHIRSGYHLTDGIATLPLSAFSKRPFVMLKKEHGTRKQADLLLQDAGIEPSVLFELDQQMTSYNITCSGIGISFISDTLIREVPFNEHIIFYKLALPFACRKIWFYWKRNRYLNRTIKEFLSMVQVKATTFPQQGTIYTTPHG